MRSLTVALGSIVVVALFVSDLKAQEGTAEKIGEKIDRGLQRLGRELKETWKSVRQSIDELGVQGRVYGRLRWDKALGNLPIDIDVQKEDVVVLTGRVPDEKAREKAVQLTEDTVGVREVVDRLQVGTR